MPKIDTKEVIKAADALSLGISIVVAILIGFGIGLGLVKLFDIAWLLWIGITIGIAAAFLNVYKAYQEQQKSFEELKNDPRYKDYNGYKEDNDDDDD